MKLQYESEAKMTFSFDFDEDMTVDDLRVALDSLPKAWRNTKIAFIDIYHNPRTISFWIDGSGIHGQGQ